MQSMRAAAMKRYVPILPILFVLLTFFYVWPGVWRYHYQQCGVEGIALRRIDTLTGRVALYNFPKHRFVRW